ncbi:hypothetical protein AB0H71_04515 [Nocardia sp. NPDC050697]|uniref:DUF7144 family membrane protein n=1 Tax=Nocardia sp. NPDC050697 TaxID=3155158 RepID=UPI00340F3DC6
MSEYARIDRKDGALARRTESGTLLLAAIMLIVAGLLHLSQGISAIAHDDLFVDSINYAYNFDLTAWGWVHVFVAIVMVVTGIALWIGSVVAQVTAVLIAALSILANFLALPHYPLWAVTIIAIDIVIMWAAASTWQPHTR